MRDSHMPPFLPLLPHIIFREGDAEK